MDVLTDPAFRAYALASSIVAPHLLALANWTGTMRVKRKQFVNPEDAKLSKVDAAAEADHPDVARVKRAHMNAVENALPFFVVGALYAATHPSQTGALAYFWTFTAARVLHSVFYLWGRQPFRSMAFAVGALATLGMAIHVIRAVV